MSKRILSVLGVIGITLSMTGCQLFEDGSARLDDGTDVCLFPELGCADVKIGPPPLPPTTTIALPIVREETHSGVSADTCASAHDYSFGLGMSYSLDGTCVVWGTAEMFDVLAGSGWYDLVRGDRENGETS